MGVPYVALNAAIHVERSYARVDTECTCAASAFKLLQDFLHRPPARTMYILKEDALIECLTFSKLGLLFV